MLKRLVRLIASFRLVVLISLGVVVLFGSLSAFGVLGVAGALWLGLLAGLALNIIASGVVNWAQARDSLRPPTTPNLEPEIRKMKHAGDLRSETLTDARKQEIVGAVSPRTHMPSLTDGNTWGANASTNEKQSSNRTRR